MFHVSLNDFGPLHFQSPRIMTLLAEPLSLSDFQWCSVSPFSQASHGHMFLPTAKLRFSMASPYIDFVTPARLLLPKQLYFPSQSLTHILYSYKATEAMPLLLFLSTIYFIEFFLFNKGFHSYRLAKTIHFKCSQNKSMSHEPNKSF